jgi:hypothetical protein
MFENPTVSISAFCMQLMCEDLVLFVWVDLPVSLCWQLVSSSFRFVYPPFFRKLCSSCNSIDRSLTEFVLAVQTALSRWPLWIWHVFTGIFFSHWPFYHLQKYRTLNHPVYPREPCWSRLSLVWCYALLTGSYGRLEESWCLAPYGCIESVLTVRSDARFEQPPCWDNSHICNFHTRVVESVKFA